MAKATSKRAVEPSPPEVYRAAVVVLDQLAPTLNRWHADGFTEDVDWYLEESEPPAFGEPSPPRVFVFARRPEEEPEPPAAPAARTRYVVRRRGRHS